MIIYNDFIQGLETLSKLDLQQYKKFIFDALLDYERTALNEGLKLYGISFEKFVSGYGEVINDTGTINVLKIPNAKITKAFQKRVANFQANPDIALRFFQVQMKIRFILMQFFINKGKNQLAITYATNFVGNLEIMKSRFPDENFSFFDTYIAQATSEILKLKQHISDVENKSISVQKTALFEWLSTEDKLRTASRKVWKNGATDNELDFYRAIKSGQPTKWNKTPEILAHLTYTLVVKKAVLKPTINKGHFKAISRLFDYRRKSTLKFRLSELSSRINKDILKSPAKRKIEQDFIFKIIHGL